MKHIKQIILVAGALFALAFTAAAQHIEGAGAFNQPTALTALTNTTRLDGSGTAIEIPLNRVNQPMNITLICVAAGAGTSNCVAFISPSYDGTNFLSTNNCFQVTNVLNGTTSVTNGRVLTAAEMTGVKKLKFIAVATTQTNGVTVSAPIWSFRQ